MRIKSTPAIVLLIVLLIIAGCTVTIQPLKPDKSDIHRKVICEPYHPPKYEDEPDFPTFTAKERRSDRLFKRKLAAYTEELQDYIDRMQTRDREAYQNYLRNCPNAQ